LLGPGSWFTRKLAFNQYLLYFAAVRIRQSAGDRQITSIPLTPCLLSTLPPHYKCWLVSLAQSEANLKNAKRVISITEYSRAN